MITRKSIGWDVPRPSERFRLLVLGDNGPSREATDEDLQRCGYVKRDDDREAEAWRKIDRWLQKNVAWSGVRIMPQLGMWNMAALRWKEAAWQQLERFEAADKTEALEALAEWCEGQP